MSDKKYKLIGADGETFLSDTKGEFGGHKKLKIYGRLDCSSALRYLEKGYYTTNRAFFPDEATVLALGYRPCGVCMKEHYRLWKEGRLMTHALKVTPVLHGDTICSVQLADHSERVLQAETLDGIGIRYRLHTGLEYYDMQISDDYCVIVLSDEKYQWGFTVVWDYVRDRLIHLVRAPFAVRAVLCDGRVVTLYLVQYWGHPADLWYSVVPLNRIDPAYDPDKVRLDILPDDSVRDVSACSITVQDHKLCFRAGAHEEWVEI